MRLTITIPALLSGARRAADRHRHTPIRATFLANSNVPQKPPKAENGGDIRSESTRACNPYIFGVKRQQSLHR